MSFLEMTVTTKSPDTDDAVDAVMDKVLADIVTEARDSMTTPKHGLAYRFRGGTRTASAPGEAPAIQTGALYASIHSTRVGSGGVVTASTDYADYLEHGTPRGQMLPRPFMGPAARHAVESHAVYEHLFKIRMEH